MRGRFAPSPTGELHIGNLRTAVLAWLGFKLGENYEVVEKYLGPVSYVVFGGIILWFIIRAIRHRGGDGHAESEPPPPREEYDQGKCQT